MTEVYINFETNTAIFVLGDEKIVFSSKDLEDKIKIIGDIIYLFRLEERIEIGVKN